MNQLFPSRTTDIKTKVSHVMLSSEFQWHLNFLIKSINNTMKKHNQNILLPSFNVEQFPIIMFISLGGRYRVLLGYNVVWLPVFLL